LDSILGQEVDFPMDVWVLDDASTDGTSDIVRKYAQQDNRVVPIIREKNLGAVLNAKSAIKLLTSEYFIITEGDDYWCDNQKIRLQVEALRKYPKCYCCGHITDLRDEKGNHIQFHGRFLKKDVKVFDIWHAPACHTTSVLFRNFLSTLTEAQWRDFEGDNLYLYKALDCGDMIYLNRVMSVYSITRKGIWTSLSKKIRVAQEQVNFYKIDQFFDFKYTKIFQPRYLPGGIKTLFSISLPVWKGRTIMLPIKK
jgi:glycosyltransferase involved in cell wall biosynthesis